MARTITFEGRQITVPDDATDDEVRGILNAAPAAPQAPPLDPMRAGGPPEGARELPGNQAPFAPFVPTSVDESVAAMPLGSRIAHRGQAFSQAAGKGLANIAGMPVDLPVGIWNLLQMGLSKAGGMLPEELAPPIDPATGKPKNSPLIDFSLGDIISGGASKVAETLGVPPLSQDEMTTDEQGLYNPVAFATEAATGAGLLSSGAKRMAAAATAGARKPSIADRFVRPYVESPVRTGVGDTAAGFGQGVGLDVADSINQSDEFKDYLPPSVVTLLSMLGGGIGGSSALDTAQSAGRMAMDVQPFGKIAKNVPIDPLTMNPTTKNVRDQAARIAPGYATDPMTGERQAGQAAEEIGKNAARIEGQGLQMPSSGSISGNSGVQEMEGGLRAQNNRVFRERDENVVASASNRMASIKDPNADQGAVRTRAEAARDERMAPVEGAQRTAEDNLANVESIRRQESADLGVRGGDVARSEASQRLDKTLVDETYRPMRADKNARWDAVDPNQNEFVPSAGIVDTVRAIRDDLNRFTPVRNELPEFADRLEQLFQNVTVDTATGQETIGAFFPAPLRDLVDLQKYMDTARKAARLKGSFDLADNIGDLQDTIRDTISSSPAARDAIANQGDYTARFRPGPGDEGAKFTKDIDRDNTRSKTPPSQTAGRFLSKSEPEKVAALQRMLRGSASEAEGLRAATDYLMADFAENVTKGADVASPEKAAAWRKSNESLLNQFPDLRGEVDDAIVSAQRGADASADAGAAVRDTTKTAQETAREVDASAIGKLLSDDPRNVARSVFSGKRWGTGKKLDEINAIIGNDAAAKRGWQAAVADDIVDHITSAADGDLMEPGVFRATAAKSNKFFKDHREDLAKVFSPAEMQTLQQGHELIKTLENTGLKSAVGGSNTADKWVNLKKSVEIGLKAKYGILKGGGIMRTLRLAASAFPNDQAAVQRLLLRATLDPELMQDLLTAKLRNLDYYASNAWLRRTVAGNEAVKQGTAHGALDLTARPGYEGADKPQLEATTAAPLPRPNPVLADTNIRAAGRKVGPTKLLQPSNKKEPGKIGQFLEWIGIGKAQEAYYPTTGEARDAIKAGSLRGEQVQPIAGGDAQKVLGTTTFESVKKLFEGDRSGLIEGFPTEELSLILGKAALALEKTSLGKLGFDPSRIVSGSDETSGQLTAAGFYLPEQDLIWFDPKFESTVVHESIHRGISKLKKGGYLKGDEFANEEILTRHIMLKNFGEVEKGRGKLGDEQVSRAKSHSYALEKSAKKLEDMAKDYLLYGEDP